MSRRAAESVSTACTSSQIESTIRALLDCSAPMKCQRNRSPYSSCLPLHVLDAILADDVDAGLGEHRHLVRSDVLGGRDDGDPGPRLGADRPIRLGDRVGVHASSSRARSRSQSRSFRAGSVTTASSRVCERVPDLRALGETDREQIVSRHREVADAVRLRPLLHEQSLELPRAPRARSQEPASHSGLRACARSGRMRARLRARRGNAAHGARRSARRAPNAWAATILATACCTSVG